MVRVSCADSPVRTCIGCRGTAPRQDLLRYVLHTTAEVSVEFDAHKALPGRGAWLHPDPRCLEKALKRRAFSRAFRRSVPESAVVGISVNKESG